MGIILSIEPLKENWILEIERRIGETIKVVLKDEILKDKDAQNNAEVLICRDRDLTEDFLELFPQLHLIYIVSAGVENLPFQYLKKRDILVANTGGVSDSAMSDYVIGAILMFSCKFWDCFNYKQERYWKPYLITDSLQGKELLIVGAGRVGQAVAEKGKSFGLRTTGIKKTISEVPFFDEIDILDNLDTHLEKADYIVCTLPLTQETCYLFDEMRFHHMKEEAVFINISRGKLVKEEGLVKALRKGRIRGAVLDVFEKEPLDESSELWNLENLIITPHSSGRIEDFLKYSMYVFEKNIINYRNGKMLPNKVDLVKGY